MRCFIAVALDQQVAAAVGGLIDELRARLAGVRWVAPDRLHVTLQYLGEADVDRAQSVMARLGDGHLPAPRRIALGPLGQFPEERRARVLWLGAPGLGDCVENVRSACRAEGLAADSDAFVGHCTIGRTRDGFDAAAWSGLRDQSVRLPPLQVSSIDLFRSENGYHRIMSVPLSR